MKEHISDKQYMEVMDTLEERYAALEGMEEIEQIEIMQEIDQYGLNNGLTQEDIDMAFDEANNI
jgi:Tfp pilus assembly protein PilO